MTPRAKLSSLAVALLLALLAPALASAEAANTGSTQTAKQAGVEGVWVTADGDGWVEITREGDLYHGAIVGPTNDGRLDDENPDPALRDRPLFGLRILEGFQDAGKGKWEDGTIYDPNNGKTYSCVIELEDEKTLKVRGFIGVSLFGRTERWTRKASDSGFEVSPDWTTHARDNS